MAQPVFVGNRLSGAYNMSQNNEEAAKQDYTKDKFQLVFDIKNSYWTYFKSLELIKNIEENISQLKGHLEDAQNFYDNGLATLNDVLKVKVQLSSLKLLRIDAENASQLSMISLNSFLGLPALKKLELVSKVDIKSSDNMNLSNAVDLSFRG